MIGDVITWCQIRFSCVGEEVHTNAKTGKMSTKHEWSARCDCGDLFYLKMHAWEFPFCRAAGILNRKHNRVFLSCPDCRKPENRKRPAALASRVSDSLMLLVADVIVTGYPLSGNEVQIKAAQMQEAVFMSWFHPEEVEHAKALRVAIKNAHAAGSRGIIERVLTQGRKDGKWTRVNNKWCPAHLERSEFKKYHRPSTIRDEAVGAIMGVLSLKPNSTMKSMLIDLVALADAGHISEGAMVKLALLSGPATMLEALRRMLNYMKDELKSVCRDRKGHGARWSLVDG